MSNQVNEKVTGLSDVQAGKKRLDIEFMYLDLSICTRCRETGTHLDEAISEAAQVLKATGVEVNVQKIHVQSEGQARQLGFFSSPTIRINGADIQLDVKESPCECGESCGCEGGIDCRVWTYQGKEYTAAPKAMIIEAILREVYGGSKESSDRPPQGGDVPNNLKQFFAAKHREEGRCC